MEFYRGLVIHKSLYMFLFRKFLNSAECRKDSDVRHQQAVIEGARRKVHQILSYHQINA